jgi:hypothetical protein
MAKRIQLSRKRGWRKPDGTVVVSRPSRWGNPFRLDGTVDIKLLSSDTLDSLVALTHLQLKWGDGQPTTQGAVAAYHLALLRGQLRVTIDDVVRELSGHDLACWCKPGEPCHADVLLTIAGERSNPTETN